MRRPAFPTRRAVIRLMSKESVPLSIGVVGLTVFRAVAILISMVATGVVLGALPGSIRSGLESGAGHRLIGALLIGSAAFVSHQVVVPFQVLLTESLGRRVDSGLRQRVMAASLRPAGISHLEDPALLDTIRDAQAIGDGRFTAGTAVGGLVGVLGNHLSLLGSAALIVTFHWWLAASLVIVIVAMRGRMVADLVAAAEAGRASSEDLRRCDYVRDLALAPSVAKETRLFGLGVWIVERFRYDWLRGMKALWKERRRSGVRVWISIMPAMALVVAGISLAGLSAVRGEMTLESLVIVTQALWSTGSLFAGADDIEWAYGAAAVRSLMDLEEAVSRPELVMAGSGPAPRRLTTGIRFEKVSFVYPGDTRPVLSGLDLVVPAGHSLAIVGSNGAGKTTLVKLLARLYDPTAGSIKVDGTALCDIDPLAWQRQVASVFQDFVRFELPAADNVGFGAIEHLGDLAALRRVSNSVGAGPVVDALAEGWDTVLSRRFDGGAELSGGQWQRIALARALFAVHGGAQILVLDEPTSGLDVRAEAELFDRFLELTRGITTILISHRFSSVRHADTICVLDQGRIAEYGTHDELVARGGLYARMFGLQAERFPAASSPPATSPALAMAFPDGNGNGNSNGRSHG